MTETDIDSASPGTAPRHAVLANDNAARWLGIEVVHVADGEATITMVLRPEMLNGFGIGHGGMIFALADTAFAMACNPPEGSDETITVASGVDINFIRPGMPGRLLTAEATRRQQSGRSGIYDIQIRQSTPDGGEEIVAEFRGRSRTIPQR